MVLPQATQEDNAVLDRGSQISQRQCAGCHEMATRSSAPSYQEIVTFYRPGFSSSASNPDLRSRLASAVTHPRPGWGNFAPGPSESGLSPDDRIALASWILHSFGRDKNADEGMDK
jgi:cytochrome c551/c552